MIVKGTFLGATDTRPVGEKGYQVRSFFVDNSDKPEYPSTPEIGLGGDRCGLIENLNIQKGDEVIVHINIKGIKYKNKTTGKDAIFTKIEAWKIEKVNLEKPVQSMPAGDQNFTGVGNQAADDDLPF